MAKSARVDFKYAINLAVARGIVNMQSIGLAAIDGAPSGELRTTSMLQKTFSKQLLNLEVFGGARFALNRGGHGTL